MGRLQGRITKEDVREAGLRRWDGQNRVTTDWVNLFFEPDLSFSDGDCLVYLREPGQSSRGPAFKIHTARLRSRGFHTLLQRCTPQTKRPQCVMSNCQGCNDHRPIWELYLPTAPRSGLEATFDHHITTRNFFAWLYDRPLAGRALGKSLVDLKLRLDTYRPNDQERNQVDLISYAESQKYLDFRECIDHSLAALRLAEVLRLDDLWLDAFAHCVGLNYRGLSGSPEYQHISLESKKLINKARIALDNKLQRVNQAVGNFFEEELLHGFPGLSQVARDHLDRFRSFLHSYYIEQHGFWPPNNFDSEIVQRLICNSMYTDFRCLYEHLADKTSSAGLQETAISTAGGVCTLQNIRAFDARQSLMPLSQSLPKIPVMPASIPTQTTRSQRRSSWNPVARHREDKERRNAQSLQALIDSTNRDWTLMNCLLVRRFSEFEIETAIDDLDPISLADGRKVRWIVVYAILQSLVSVTQAPKQVRNTEGLSYALCCDAPVQMPWHIARPARRDRLLSHTSVIEPDLAHSHTNTSIEAFSPVTSRTLSLSRASTMSKPDTLKRQASKAGSTKERRQTIAESVPGRSMSMRPSTSRASSLRRLIMYKSSESLVEEPAPMPERPKPKQRTSFCEIYVPGYGNGLNEVELQITTHQSQPPPPMAASSRPTTAIRPTVTIPAPAPTSASVSRESSTASSNSTWSKPSATTSLSATGTPDDSDVSTPDASPVFISSGNMSNLDLASGHSLDTKSSASTATVHIVSALDEGSVAGYEEPEDAGGLDTVHFNTSTWDDMLNVLEKRRFGIA